MEKVLTMISQMNFKKIEDLLKAGADVNIKIGLNEDTLLHCSYTYDVTKLLLSYGVDVNARNLIGETPLHCAAIEQKGLGLVQELLKYGADVNAVDNEGPPFSQVISGGGLWMVQFLAANFNELGAIAIYY
nr:ankyrin repeat and SOCS box protein 8-like [Halyomorpha halys]